MSDITVAHLTRYLASERVPSDIVYLTEEDVPDNEAREYMVLDIAFCDIIVEPERYED